MTSAPTMGSHPTPAAAAALRTITAMIARKIQIVENTNHGRRTKAKIKERTAKSRADGPKELMMRNLPKEKMRKMTGSKLMKETASGKKMQIACGQSVMMKKMMIKYM